ncbi:MAG: DUF2065 domain-containing protein [Hyphomicrobiales bacterium]
MIVDFSDMFVAIGLWFFFEGIIFAGFPGYVRARMRDILAMDENGTRMIGLAGAVLGVVLVFIVRFFWDAG